MAGRPRWGTAGLVAAFAALGALWLFPELPASLRAWWAGAAEASCDPAFPGCGVAVRGGSVSLQLSPPDAAPQEPVTFRVAVEGDLRPTQVTLSGVDMNMGLLVAPLSPDGLGFRGELALPACGRARMTWRADVELAGGGVASFRFTSRGVAPARVWDEVQAAPEPTWPPFVLHTAAGDVRSDAWPGDALVVYFGYTSCPDVCPATLSTLASAVESLPPEQRRRVHVVFGTLDPARDDLERLTRYVEWFHPTFLAGQVDGVGGVAAAWGVSSRKVALEGSAFGYAVDHGTASYLRRPDGAVEALGHGTSAPQVAERLAAALAARPE